MEFTSTRTIQITAYLLLALVVTQVAFTLLYVAEINPSQQLFWGVESLLFVLLAAFAGGAMAREKRFSVGWAAITFSAIFNVVQVSIGLAMFGPVREAAGQIEGFDVVAGAVVALSFMIYYLAKFLLGLAALIFGLANMNHGTKVLGGLTAAVSIVAIIANGAIVTFGRDAFLPSPVAGGTGVLATLLLACCLLKNIGSDNLRLNELGSEHK